MAIAEADELADLYFKLSRRSYDPNESRLRRYTRLVFDGVPLRGRSLLDIGGGSGMMSFYAAASGAAPVVCLEPSAAGSNPRMDEDFRKWQAGMGSDVHVRLVRETLQELDPADARFDIILVHNAINHLDEDACARLSSDPEARARYHDIFTKLADLTPPGGDLIISDAARRNAWNMLGLQSPFAKTINWEIHAQPSVWADLAAEAGFMCSGITWRTHNRLGDVGQRALGNRVGSWLTNSMFILRMRRALSTDSGTSLPADS